jgi:hypothetical protein
MLAAPPCGRCCGTYEAAGKLKREQSVSEPTPGSPSGPRDS